MMKTLHKSGLLVAAAALTFSAAAVAADRPPTAEENAKLAEVLRAAGFVSWEEVELDDDGPYGDVDDARTEDGRRYDLKLDPDTLAIIDRDLED